MRHNPTFFRPLLVFVVCVMLVSACKRPKNSDREKSQGAGATTGNPAIVEVQGGKDSAFTISLQTEPAQPLFGRKTRFTIKVTDASGAPVSGAKARISLVMPLMDMGKNEFELKPSGDGVYQGAGEFTMAGEWEVVATAAANGKSGKYTFNVKVAE
jgi:hypothetical protein